jgi:hypothetical protein
LEVRAARDGIGHDIFAAFEVESLVFEALEKQGPTSGTSGEEGL